MDTDELGSLLDSIGTVRHACDLDLLLFFPGIPARCSLSSNSFSASATNTIGLHNPSRR